MPSLSLFWAIFGAMKNSLFQRLQPHLIAVGVFLLISFLYFLPVLQGKVLSMHDISQWTAMSKEVTDYRNATGEEALWTNCMFGGMPAYQISLVSKANWTKFLTLAFTMKLPEPVNLLFISLLSFYILLLTLRADWRLAIAGAIAFTFCSYTFVAIQAGHISKVHAIGLMPLIVAGILLAYRGRFLLGAAMTAAGLAMEIYANHLQVTYYLSMAIGLLLVVELIKAIKEKTIGDYFKASIALAIGAAIAVLPNITNLMATAEYGQYSTRGPSELTAKKESSGLDQKYATDWSYGIMESMTLLIPDFKGGSSAYNLGESSETYKAISSQAGDAQARSFVKSAPLYWGDQPMTQGPVYNGAIPFFLFVLALFILRGEMLWWFISVFILSLVLSWGKNFTPVTDFFFAHFPAYNKFRAVAMILVLASFVIPFAGTMGLIRMQELMKTNRDELLKKTKLAFYLTGGFCLIFILLPALFCDFNGPADESFKQYDWLLIALKKDRESMLRMDAIRSLFFVSVGFGLVWFWLKEKIKPSMFFIALSFFILVDMWMVDKRYLNDSNFVAKSSMDHPFEMTSADEQILQDKGYYRVMNTTVSTFNDASTSYFHKSIGGYHGAKLKRYQELIENQIANGNINVLNMLNAKYFIIRNPQDQSPMVQMNPGALGNAWFVDNWKVVPNADAEIKALDSLDTRHTVVVDQRYAAQLNGLNPAADSLSTIKLAENGYAPNKLKYESNSTAEHLAVFSEIFYPKGWNAYIDGKKSDYMCANYVLRAMKIPAGKHEIEFRFEPEVYRNGENMAMVGSILLYLGILAAAIVEFRKSASSTEAK